MKNNKGFTLIEVLAILIVLSIISIITVPIILNTLDNSKKGTAMDSAYGYVEAVNRLYYSNSMDGGDDIDDGIYSVSELKTMGVSVSGREPSDGWCELVEGDVVSYSIKIGDYVVTKYSDSDPVAVKDGEVQEDSAIRNARLAVSAEVSDYISELLADSTIQGYTKDTGKKVSEISTPTAPTGVDTDSWVYFKKESSSVTAPDYSIKITIGDYTFVVNSVNGTVSDPSYNGELLPQKKPASFADDSWADIKANLAANRNAYPIGSTKIIEFDRDNEGDTGYGTNEYYKLRLVNTSPCSESTATSKTSCGVVIEFVTTIGTYVMNSSDTNAGGWYSSAMRAYLNSETNNIYSKLPSDLQSAIISTTPVISGSGSGGVSNNAEDYLYLLSGKEVGFNLYYDNKKSDTDTKTLKYYSDNNNDTSRIKYSTATGSGNTGVVYWLRSAYSNYASYFYDVIYDGSNSYSGAGTAIGVAPAFRILD